MAVQQTVFVRSINSVEGGARVVVEASNGGPEGPPFVRFELPRDWVENCHVGSRFSVRIEEFD